MRKVRRTFVATIAGTLVLVSLGSEVRDYVEAAAGEILSAVVTAGADLRRVPGDAALPGAGRFAIAIAQGNCGSSPPRILLRHEDRAEPHIELGQLDLCPFRGAVSPEGRRLAYVRHADPHASEIVLYAEGATRALVRLEDETVSSLVWTPDGSGMLFVASRGGDETSAPQYAALRTFDFRSGLIQELLRTSGRFLDALAWDRSRRMVAAAGRSPTGGTVDYIVISEQHMRRHQLSPDFTFVGASSNGEFVAGWWRTENVIGYWPLGSFGDLRELRPERGSGVARAVWRPRERELAVLVSGGGTRRIELWSINGARRRITELAEPPTALVFRPDGSGLFVGSRTVVEVDTGRHVQLSLAPEEDVVASLLR